MEKWGTEEILVYPHGVWLGKWKSGEIENFFVWLRRKWDDWKCSLYKFSLIPLLDKFFLKKRQNYDIGPLSLSCVRNRSLKFEACAISLSGFQNEQYKFFY